MTWYCVFSRADAIPEAYIPRGIPATAVWPGGVIGVMFNEVVCPVSIYCLGGHTGHSFNHSMGYSQVQVGKGLKMHYGMPAVGTLPSVQYRPLAPQVKAQPPPC